MERLEKDYGDFWQLFSLTVFQSLFLLFVTDWYNAWERSISVGQEAVILSFTLSNSVFVKFHSAWWIVTGNINKMKLRKAWSSPFNMNSAGDIATYTTIQSHISSVYNLRVYAWQLIICGMASFQGLPANCQTH